MSADDDTIEGTLAGVGIAHGAPAPAVVASRYRIVRWLGGGGMGRVYEAFDEELGERVALKMLRAGLSEVALERFRREVKLTRRIQHHNVARMFDIGDHADEKFLTMELVDGESLTAALAPPVAAEPLRELALQLCAGLAAAHAVGVVHRDLKPDNVLIERASGRVVITDFGIALAVGDDALTLAGTVVGTPRYMAPEQLAGTDVDARADVFSLGVMLYELASGSRPWQGETPLALAVAQATQPPRPLRAQLPATLAAVIEQCIAPDREHRPAGVAAIARALEQTMELVPPVLAPVPPRVARRATSVGVLPFRSAPDEQYVADWLREDLADTLSGVAGLRIRLAHPHAELDAVTVGRELGVDHVIAGSVRRVPGGMRVAARLVSVADGFQLWARRADHAEAEVLALCDELAHELAAVLSTRAERPARAAVIDPRSVELYLRARAQLRRYWGEHAQAATELLEAALVHAPDAPEIVGAYAVAAVLAWVRIGDPQLLPRAHRAVERARAVDSADALLASALLRLNHGDIERGASELAAAVARAPMSPAAHDSLARLLIEVDLIEDGQRHFDTALGLDPGRAPLVEMDRARIDALHGNLESALRRIAALEADPDPAIAQLGLMIESRIAAWRGDAGAALAAAAQISILQTAGTDARDIVTHAGSGALDLGDWQRLLEQLSAIRRPRRMQLVALQRVVEIAVLVDQRERAIAMLARAIELGLTDIVWFDRCPLLASLRADPQVVSLRAQLVARVERVRVALAG